MSLTVSVSPSWKQKYRKDQRSKHRACQEAQVWVFRSLSPEGARELQSVNQLSDQTHLQPIIPSARGLRARVQSCRGSELQACFLEVPRCAALVSPHKTSMTGKDPLLFLTKSCPSSNTPTHTRDSARLSLADSSSSVRMN